MVYVRLPGQPYAGNKAGTQIDHPFVDSRNVRIWVEHGNSIGEEKVNIVGMFGRSESH